MNESQKPIKIDNATNLDDATKVTVTSSNGVTYVCDRAIGRQDMYFEPRGIRFIGSIQHSQVNEIALDGIIGYSRKDHHKKVQGLFVLADKLMYEQRLRTLSVPIPKEKRMNTSQTINTIKIISEVLTQYT